MTDLAPLLPLASDVIGACAAKGLTVVTAESCTGGLVAAALTEIAGSSAVVDRGLVTYSNEAKMDLLGVPPKTIESFGAVSEATAIAMVEGAIARSQADLAVAVTGIAGPGGGSADKPIGLVHFAALRRGHQAIHEVQIFAGCDRSGVRLASVDRALRLLLEIA